MIDNNIASGLIAIAIALIGCASVYAIAKIASKGFDAMARQPEVADMIKSAMITPMGFIEGALVISGAMCIGVAHMAINAET